MQDYLGALIVLATAGASIWGLDCGIFSRGLVGLGLTYALTVSITAFLTLTKLEFIIAASFLLYICLVSRLEIDYMLSLSCTIKG